MHSHTRQHSSSFNRPAAAQQPPPGATATGPVAERLRQQQLPLPPPPRAPFPFTLNSVNSVNSAMNGKLGGKPVTREPRSSSARWWLGYACTRPAARGVGWGERLPATLDPRAACVGGSTRGVGGARRWVNVDVGGLHGLLRLPALPPAGGVGGRRRGGWGGTAAYMCILLVKGRR